MSFHHEKQPEAVSHISDDRDDYKVSNAGNATVTLTAAHLLSGILYSTPVAAITLTLPDAADIVAADPKAEAKAGLHFYLRNDGGYAITVAAGAGTTLSGSGTIAANGFSHFYLRYSNTGSGAEAVTVARLG